MTRAVVAYGHGRYVRFPARKKMFDEGAGSAVVTQNVIVIPSRHRYAPAFSERIMFRAYGPYRAIVRQGDLRCTVAPSIEVFRILLQ